MPLEYLSPVFYPKQRLEVRETTILSGYSISFKTGVRSKGNIANVLQT